MNKICHLVLILFATCAAQAQVTPAVQDTIKKGFSIGKITIKDPKSILSGYTYDPVTDRYVYTNSVNGFTIDYPIILTPKEYESLVLKESMRNYFRKKIDAIESIRKTTEFHRNIPTLKQKWYDVECPNINCQQNFIKLLFG